MSVDTVRNATNREITVVTGEKADYAGTSNFFTTDQAFGTTPTLTITLSCTQPNVDIKKFRLEEVHYQLDPTNAVTYQLYLLEATNADDYESGSDVVFESASSQADNTRYIHVQGGFGTTASYKLPRIVELETAGTLYYMIDWSAAPSSTKGYIKVKGTLLK